ncbi:uncharacterized protein LOC131259149 [Anopheles coustani]|uniref:uncharacterized protein LOC131259149 n=1 Tax=Anopheles coustani TaxID=139045 RepID=UPI002657DB86|nr:uncharacterized protein LOC131259149 [Anopheles coustani]XP_058116560.1 uncharacterized protein LOC131259149 [Anopheles coustani]
MKLLWFFVFLLALVGGAFGSDSASCPPNFERKDDKCVTPRPVHGTCREGSTYSVALNLCVAD